MSILLKLKREEHDFLTWKLSKLKIQINSEVSSKFLREVEIVPYLEELSKLNAEIKDVEEWLTWKDS